MNKPILALIDSSAYGKSVCDLAIWAAKAMHVPLRLLHVLDKAIEEIDVPESILEEITLEAQNDLTIDLSDIDLVKARVAQKLGQALVDRSKNYIVERGVTEVETRLRHDTLLDALTFYARDAHMVIIGKRGEKSNNDKSGLGKNFESVVQASERPILVATSIVQPVRKVLIAFDGGVLIQSAIDYICKYRLFRNAKCIVAMAGRASAEQNDKLDAAIARLRVAGIAAEVFHSASSYEKMMQEEVPKQDIDMIVVGAFNRGKLRNFLFGSPTQTVILRSKVPVMVMREV